MTTKSTIKLLLIFAVAFSLLSLPGATPANVHLPRVRADPAPTVQWTPAGASMNTELIKVFQDEATEFNCFNSPTPCVDITDWPLTSSIAPGIKANPNYFVTTPINDTGYFEIQYNLAANFLGCTMDFGNSPCGREIRQAFAHLVDKSTFTNQQGDIAGFATPIDNPVPFGSNLNGLNMVGPIPCSWDTIAAGTAGAPSQIASTGGNPSGPQCKAGANGGVAYHLANAVAFTGQQFAWQYGPGSPDFCAAAFHFVRAGIASGFNPTTCQLTGLSAAVLSGGNSINVFARIDNNPRFQLGTGLAQSICALFTGSFASTTCNVPGSTTLSIVTFTPGTISSFPGFTTDPTRVAVTWQIYTAGFGSVFPWDSSAYFGYNSALVDASGGQVYVRNGGHCLNTAFNSSAPANYEYICVPAYDTASNAMEFAPCLNAPGDPAIGETSATLTFAKCPTAPTSDTAITATYKALDTFGQFALTNPIYTNIPSFGYLKQWNGVVSDVGNGIPNFFTWLNAYSSTPLTPNTITQGFKQQIRTLNPWNAVTIWDFFVLGNSFDSLGALNPGSKGQLLDWLTVNTVPTANANLGYTPPAGTVLSYRFTLRNDVFWHDHHQLTAWDAKFSYAALLAGGAFQSASLSPMVCNITSTCADGITVLSPTQFDVHVSSSGPFQKYTIVGPTILPGRYWSTCAGSAWDSAVAAGSVADSCMAPIAGGPGGQDPVKTGIMVGSGPWECISTGTGGFPAGTLGGGCTSSGDGKPLPGGTLTFQRFGKSHDPGTSLTDDYFRSGGNLALWAWSGNTGDSVHDFLLFGIVAKCFGQAPGPLGGIPAATSCAHWQQGIGANGGPTAIGSVQIGIVLRFNSVNWVHPFDWVTNPPKGIASFPPTIHVPFATSALSTLTPASTAGCSVAYPTGGYDC